MGNSHNKNSQNRSQKQSATEGSGQAFSSQSQFSVSQFVGNFSGRSFLSVASNQSVYSASRPWSRVSRRRWNDSTLNSPLEASKTAWPVSHKESIFLPEFPITTDFLQRDYEIIETIAKGAFGQVYKVNKVSEGKEYALKLLSKSQVISESAVRQVKEEARIQTACGHHSFIASAVGRWQTKKSLYIVSEYIPCGELLALLVKYGQLPEELVKIFTAEIAIAIDFLHNAGVVYRDLKPENILLDAALHVRLVDFGLSKWLSVGARTTTLCGTLNYMAPEMLSREPYGHAVDWWSLGVIVCRMLTNEFPEPAVRPKATNNVEGDAQNSVLKCPPMMTLSGAECTNKDVPSRLQPGKLPTSAALVSPAARGLLVRLLDCDPRVRLRTLRQLQQTAFYMGFNFEQVKRKKVSPQSVLERYFPGGTPDSSTAELRNTSQAFVLFEQATLV